MRPAGPSGMNSFSTARKFRKGRLWFGSQIDVALPPDPPDRTRMKRLVGEQKTLAPGGAQPLFNKIEVKRFVTAIKLVANNMVTVMGEVNAYLVLASSQRPHAQKRVIPLRSGETP